MNFTQSIKNISPAFLRAQKNMEGAKKTAANPFFKSKYADLSAVIEACKGHLNAEGIAILQPVGQDEKGHYVETVLLHESGECFSEKMYFVTAPVDIQKQGAAVSYLRRYGLQSFIGLPAEDDDGNSAVAAKSADTNPTKVLGIGHEIIEMTKTFNDEKFTSMVVSMISKAGTNVAELNIIKDKVRNKLAEKGAMNGTR